MTRMSFADSARFRRAGVSCVDYVRKLKLANAYLRPGRSGVARSDEIKGRLLWKTVCPVVASLAAENLDACDHRVCLSVGGRRRYSYTAGCLQPGQHFLDSADPFSPTESSGNSSGYETSGME